MRNWLAHLLLILFAAVIFLAGITWGLPSRQTDKFLFGNKTPWTGRQILDLAGPWNPSNQRGADVDINPLNRNRAQILNETDAQRAEIVRRYRLFSYQPDEMITFRALGQMKPSQLQLDPRLYQYGGLWIYPVGALLKIASLLHVATVTSDLAFYLDHPEIFARFYVIARLYCALWGIIGSLVIYKIAQRFMASNFVAFLAGCAFIFCPAVVNMAHEAKPHLPGAVLMLIAIYFAIRYIDAGTWHHAIAAATACGGAFAMVLSALPIFIILPLMTLLRRDAWNRRIKITLTTIACGFSLYAMTNPYVVIHLVSDRTVLFSNLANSRAMYHANASSSAISTAIWLIAEGTSAIMAIVAVIGLIILSLRGHFARAAIIFAAPVVLVLIQFTTFAAGKPGEYARFALLIDIAIVLAAVLSINTIIRIRTLAIALTIVVLIVQFAQSALYLRGYLSDSSHFNSRLNAATELSYVVSPTNNRLVISAEPAPYILPPVDLFRWKLVLPPRDGTIADDAWTTSIRTLPWREVTPMSWAGIFFQIALNPAPPLTAQR